MKEARVVCRACGERFATAYRREGRCPKCGELLAECGDVEGWTESAPARPARAAPALTGYYLWRALPVLIAIPVGAYALIQGKGCNQVANDAGAQLDRTQRFIEGRADEQAPQPVHGIADRFRSATGPTLFRPSPGKGSAPPASPPPLTPAVRAVIAKWQGKLFVDSDGTYVGEIQGNEMARRAVRWAIDANGSGDPATQGDAWLDDQFQQIYQRFVVAKGLRGN